MPDTVPVTDRGAAQTVICRMAIWRACRGRRATAALRPPCEPALRYAQRFHPMLLQKATGAVFGTDNEQGNCADGNLPDGNTACLPSVGEPPPLFARHANPHCATRGGCARCNSKKQQVPKTAPIADKGAAQTVICQMAIWRACRRSASHRRSSPAMRTRIALRATVSPDATPKSNRCRKRHLLLFGADDGNRTRVVSLGS